MFSWFSGMSVCINYPKCSVAYLTDVLPNDDSTVKLGIGFFDSSTQKLWFTILALSYTVGHGCFSLLHSFLKGRQSSKAT